MGSPLGSKSKSFFVFILLAFSVTFLTVLLYGDGKQLHATFIRARNHLGMAVTFAAGAPGAVTGKNSIPPCHPEGVSEKQQYPCQISQQSQQQNGNRTSFRLTDFNESLTKSGNEFWKKIKPGFSCPDSLLRNVGDRSAGKWTCGLNNLGSLGQRSSSAPCVIYSFGVSDNSQFEAEILKSAPHCHIYAYDPTVTKMGYPFKGPHPNVHFKPIGIGGDDKGNFSTLKTLMQQNGGHRWIDILKIDVEGAEYRSLNRILEDFKGQELPVGHLLLEVHVWAWGRYLEKGKPLFTARIDKNLLHRKAVETVQFFNRLESRGLRMFYFEVNPTSYYAQQCCSEVSFINTNAFALNRFLGRNWQVILENRNKD